MIVVRCNDNNFCTTLGYITLEREINKMKSYRREKSGDHLTKQMGHVIF